MPCFTCSPLLKFLHSDTWAGHWGFNSPKWHFLTFHPEQDEAASTNHTGASQETFPTGEHKSHQAAGCSSHKLAQEHSPDPQQCLRTQNISEELFWVPWPVPGGCDSRSSEDAQGTVPRVGWVGGATLSTPSTSSAHCSPCLQVSGVGFAPPGHSRVRG